MFIVSWINNCWVIEIEEKNVWIYFLSSNMTSTSTSFNYSNSTQHQLVTTTIIDVIVKLHGISNSNAINTSYICAISLVTTLAFILIVVYPIYHNCEENFEPFQRKIFMVLLCFIGSGVSFLLAVNVLYVASSGIDVLCCCVVCCVLCVVLLCDVV